MDEQIENDIVPLELPKLELPEVNRERKTNDDFMGDLIRVANDVNKAIILMTGVVPQKDVGHEKLDVLRGHLVRMFKLYDTYIFLIIERRTETAFIILRSLAETVINFLYLLKHVDTDVYKKYKRASLVYEKHLEDSILGNIRDRKEELPIEKRMLKSITNTFLRSGLGHLEEKELKKTQWGLDKQHLETSGKAKDIGLYSIYEYLFKTSSHFVHGSWHELDFHHLEQTTDRRGTRPPQMRYTTPKPQLLEAVSIFVTEALQQYLSTIVEESNNTKELKDYLNKISKWFFDISQEHEKYLHKKS